MGTRRKRERQQDLWIATSDVVETPANAFYDLSVVRMSSFIKINNLASAPNIVNGGNR